jgi:hypothetical protein
MKPKSPVRFHLWRSLTLLVTNATKISGLAVALNEMLLRSTLRPAAVAASAFMMAGAQLSESAVLAALDRLLGRDREPEK